MVFGLRCGKHAWRHALNCGLYQWKARAPKGRQWVVVFMTVTTDNGNAGRVSPSSGPDDVHDALVRASHDEQGDTEFLAILLQGP